MFGLSRSVASCCLLALPMFSAALLAQGPAGRITGIVTDSATTRPLSGANVSVAGTRLGAATDEEGRYTINGVPAGTLTLDVRRLGFKAVTRPGVAVTAGGTATVNIALPAIALSLEAIVTTGVVDPTSGTSVPFTVGRVEADNLPVPATNAVESIQGKIAGVTIVPSGQPGSGTNIMLRTPTSINKSNTPLMVIDGVIQTTAFSGSTADLEAMDIESIEIVKGAAAASLYGSRAQSGVIQIRTKRGNNQAEGPTKYTLRSEVGVNSLGGNMHWAQYHQFMTDSNATTYVNAAGAPVLRSQRVAKPIYQRFQDSKFPGAVYDQVDRFFHPGNTYKNAFNISQNAGRTNWLMSVVNSKEDGVVLNSGTYSQTDVRLNLDHRLRDNLQLSFSGYHSRSLRYELYGDTFFDLINQSPDIDLRQRDSVTGMYVFQGDATEGREENPLYVLSTEDSKRRRARTQGSLQARFSPLSWLSFDGNVSYDRSDRRNNFFLDAGVLTEGYGAAGGPGEIRITNGQTDAINAAASANLLQRFGSLTLRSTGRVLIERENNTTSTAEGTFLATRGVRSLDNATQRQLESSQTEIRSSGYFVTLGADYRGKYIFDGLVRRDGSSLFGPEERWNQYYRLSGSWRMAEEPWWPFRFITEFKPRISRGTAGGRPDFDDQFETFAFIDGGGLTKENLGNPFLKPELSTETEFGVDAIIRDRYSLQVAYAKNRVVDQLLQIPLVGFYGYSNQWQNAGTVEGNTIEGTLEAQVIRRPNLTWRVGLVADRSRNKITEFNRACQTVNTIAFRCAGETLGAMYGFHFLNNASELPADAATRAAEFAVNDDGLLVWVGPGNKFTEGETKKLWGTTTSIGTTNYGWGMPITQRDETGSAKVVRIGDGNPKFHWGLSNNVGWKDFQFYGLVDANVGGQVYNQTNQRMYQYGRSSDVDQAGKPQELKKIVDYYVALYSAADPTEYFVEDAGFVKLREVSVRYRVPQRYGSLLRRLGASGASVSLIGRNLWTSTKYSGYDPEVGGTIVRIDSFAYPRYRTFTGSIELNF
ncbi:MAG TPA: SusC/RagA family TonB-linked outer membrane protein [Gemmatimonadaceae bacterium]